MRTRFALVVYALAMAVGTPASQADEPKPDSAEAKELEKLQGSWELAYGMFDGKELKPSEEEGRSVITITKNRYVVKRKDKLREEGTLSSFDTAKSPAVFHHTITKCPYDPSLEGKRIPGIYILADDLYIACANATTVPAKFSADAGSENMLVIYKRVGK